MTNANRAAILAFTGAERIRITRNGEVLAYGLLPNTNHTGWYFAGWMYDILDDIAFRQRRHLRSRNVTQ